MDNIMLRDIPSPAHCMLIRVKGLDNNGANFPSISIENFKCSREAIPTPTQGSDGI